MALLMLSTCCVSELCQPQPYCISVLSCSHMLTPRSLWTLSFMISVRKCPENRTVSFQSVLLRTKCVVFGPSGPVLCSGRDPSPFATALLL